jgi:hypothetical protein
MFVRLDTFFDVGTEPRATVNSIAISFTMVTAMEFRGKRNGCERRQEGELQKLHPVECQIKQWQWQWQ